MKAFFFFFLPFGNLRVKKESDDKELRVERGQKKNDDEKKG